MQPSPSPTRPTTTRTRALSRDAGETRHVEGLDGSTELRRVPGGYWQVWPRPTHESLRTLYGERFYEEDKSSYLDDVERDRPYWDAIWSIRREAMEAALPTDRRRLLDIGSSGGALLDHFRQHDWQPFGIEPSPHAARYARDRFGLDVFRGELLDADPERDLSGGRFDAIHCAQVLEHVLEPEACVARIADLLAPDGVAFIEVPNDFSAFQTTARERLGLRAWWVAPEHHLNYFDADSLAGLLRRFGLVEIDRFASFPMELFLLMGDDYVSEPERGATCHAKRMAFERSFLDTGRMADLAALYRALAMAGAGRTCGLLVRKAAEAGCSAGGADA